VLQQGRRQHWSMTERGESALRRDADRLALGGSSVSWQDGCLRFALDEGTFPRPGRIRGEVCFTPQGSGAGEHALDDAGRHHWLPLAPRGRVEVNLTAPRLSFRGSGYFDHNRGSEPLERAFRSWSWSRWTGPRGTLLHYDVCRRSAPPLALRLRLRADGACESLPPQPQQPLPKSLWRIARTAPADLGFSPCVLQTLVDAPFYARSLLESTLDGHRVTGIHESLSLDRFASRWVQALLPFRMPRRGGARRG
jgi:carotenoid 1,2-hydratase